MQKKKSLNECANCSLQILPVRVAVPHRYLKTFSCMGAQSIVYLLNWILLQPSGFIAPHTIYNHQSILFSAKKCSIYISYISITSHPFYALWAILLVRRTFNTYKKSLWPRQDSNQGPSASEPWMLPLHYRRSDRLLVKKWVITALFFR